MLVGEGTGVVSIDAGRGFEDVLLDVGGFVCCAGGAMGALEGVLFGVSITIVGGAVVAIMSEYEVED